MAESERDEWLTVRAVSDLLKVHEETVRRWIRDEGLPAMLLGSARGGYRIRQTDLDQFLAEKFVDTGKAAPVAARTNTGSGFGGTPP